MTEKLALVVAITRLNTMNQRRPVSKAIGRLKSLFFILSTLLATSSKDVH